MPDSVRMHALSILNALSTSGATATVDRLIENAPKGGSSFDSRDRRLFNALVYGVLRWRSRLDWIVAHFSKTPIKKIDERVLNVMRLGLFQIMFMDRIPDSAAVNTSVELVKAWAPQWIVRYVNGVLRNASRSWQSVPLPHPTKHPAHHLEVSQAMPSWIIKRWINRFGVQETTRLCSAINQVPPITLRVNTLKIGRDRLASELSKQAQGLRLTPFSPMGITLQHIHGSVPQLAGFDQCQWGRGFLGQVAAGRAG